MTRINKSFASTHNAKILNSFSPALQIRDTESAIKNKLQKLVSELRGFKFVTTLLLVLKACAHYFYQIFIFSPNDSLQKLWKMLFVSSKKLFSFSS